MHRARQRPKRVWSRKREQSFPKSHLRQYNLDQETVISLSNERYPFPVMNGDDVFLADRTVEDVRSTSQPC